MRQKEVMNMGERTLEGIMADARVSKNGLAKELKMSRSTLDRKMKSGNFTVFEIGNICRFFKLTDPLLIHDLFLRRLFQ